MKTNTQITMSLLAVLLGVVIPPQDAVGDTGEDLIPVQEAACAKPMYLSKKLVLEFVEPDTVAWLMDKNGSLLVDMMTTLKETYNELSFYYCDYPLFRQIDKISVLDNDSNNKSTSADRHNYYGSPTLTFELEMSCSNCTADQPLFEIPIIPFDTPIRNATTTNTTFFQTDTEANITFYQTDMEIATRKKHAERQGNHSDYNYCICPADQDIYPASLTAEDFVLLVNEKLIAEQMNVTITHSMELEELTCSSIVRQFTSRIYMDMDFSGNTFPSIDEVRYLEESLMQTYNRFSFESCDPYHRRINRAKLGFKLDAEDILEEDGMSPTWQNTNAPVPSNNLSLWWNTTSWNTTSPWWNTTSWNSTSNESSTLDVVPKRHILKAVLTLDAECRNCSVNSAGWFSLFDNGAGIELPTGEEHWNASGNPDTEEISLNEKARSNLRHARSSTWEKDLPTAWQDPTNTTCVCPVKQEPDMTLTNHTRDSQSSGASSTIPTEESILHFYNAKIEQGREEGLIEMVESVNNLEEGQVINCGPNISLFNSQVFADISVDPTNITSQQIRKVEQAVMDAYNELAFRTCDGLFRAITEVELIFYHNASYVNSSYGYQEKEINVTAEVFHHHNTSSGFHNSSAHLIHNSSSGSENKTENSDIYFVGSDFVGVNSTDDAPQGLVATLFSIKGECRGCEVSSSGTFNLFDDAFDGRRRWRQGNQLVNEGLPWRSRYTGGFAGDPSTCFCLAGVELDAFGQGPTSEAFGEALAKEIALMDQNEELESVEATVGDILEGIQVSCTGEVQDFTSYIYADLGITAGEVTKEVKEELESVFLETYNSLSFQACDEFFRVVEEVRLLISDEPSFDSVNTTNTADVSAVHLEVFGHCRNCPVTNGHFNLFDDAFTSSSHLRKRKLEKRSEGSVRTSNPMPPSGNRASEALDFCLCPHGKLPGEDPPPSKETFLSEFNRNLIEDQKEKGTPEEGSAEEELVDTPILFVEVEEVKPPSRGAPVSFYSPFSTAAPTHGPKPQSLRPSPEPTLKPTPDPTTAPTAEPSSSSMPSQQPNSQSVAPLPVLQPTSPSLNPVPEEQIQQPTLSADEPTRASPLMNQRVLLH